MEKHLRELINPKEETSTEKESAPRAKEKSSLTIGSLAAISKSLAPSTLFGHIYGSFTGGEGEIGLFSKAGTGTLLIDEYLAIPGHLQKLQLTALSSGLIQPIGGDKPTTFACPVIAATNRATNETELEQLQKFGEVPLDLMERFSHRCCLPALRDRPEEIVPALIAIFAHHESRRPNDDGDHDSAESSQNGNERQLREHELKITETALEVLLSNSFEGNFRRLARVADAIYRNLVFRKGEHIEVRDLVAAGLVTSETQPDGFQAARDDADSRVVTIQLHWERSDVETPVMRWDQRTSCMELWEQWLGRARANRLWDEAQCLSDLSESTQFCLKLGEAAYRAFNERADNPNLKKTSTSYSHQEHATELFSLITKYGSYPLAETNLLDRLSAAMEESYGKHNQCSGRWKAETHSVRPSVAAASLEMAFMLLTGTKPPELGKKDEIQDSDGKVS
ncbi:MAG: sigma 54-interacting transcriptional regulator [Planctomycetota bacterium]